MGISRIDSWTPFSLLHWLTHSPFGGLIPFISDFLILNIHWKDWCWSWSSNTLATWWEEPTHWKRPWCWERLRAGREGGDRRWMVGWHPRLNGHESEPTPGKSERQGSLVCCHPFDHKESDMTESLNNKTNTVNKIRIWSYWSKTLHIFLE